MSNKILYIKDGCRYNETLLNVSGGRSLYSTLRFIDDTTGEDIFEPLHNRTVIAGAGFTLQKVFGLDRSCLDNTPTYDSVLGLDDAATNSAYPTVNIMSDTNTVIGSMPDETQIREVYCDRPFAYAIVDTSTMNPIFLGTYNG